MPFRGRKPATTAAIHIGEEIAAMAVADHGWDQRSHFSQCRRDFLLCCGPKASEKSLNPLEKSFLHWENLPDLLEKLSTHWQNPQTHWKNP
jgi:hypothetical protein